MQDGISQDNPSVRDKKEAPSYHGTSDDACVTHDRGPCAPNTRLACHRVQGGRSRTPEPWRMDSQDGRGNVASAHPDNTCTRFQHGWAHPLQVWGYCWSSCGRWIRTLFRRLYPPRWACWLSGRLGLGLVFGNYGNSNLRVHFHDFSPVGSVNFGRSLLFTITQAIWATIYSMPYDMDPSWGTNKHG